MDDISVKLTQTIVELSSPLAPIPTGASENLEPLRGIRAVLFDVYGVLFISCAGDIGINEPVDSDSAFQDAMTSAGFHWLSEYQPNHGPALLKSEIKKTHVFKHDMNINYPEVDILEEWEKVVSSLIDQNIIQGEITESSIKQLALEYELRVNPVWPMPHLNTVINKLQQSPMILGIISNAQFYTPYLFETFAGGQPGNIGFQESLCIWSYRCGEGKPSLRMFQTASDRLQQQFDIAPHETVFIGNDMRNDIWTASQVGFRTILFAGDQRSLRIREDDSRCASLKPDRIICNLADICRIFPDITP
jgi:putative hydrolase of the HAD superfamily